MQKILLTEHDEIFPIPGFKHHVDNLGNGKFLISEKRLVKGIGFVVSKPVKIVNGEIYQVDRYSKTLYE